MPAYIPNQEQLEKARAKNSFTMVLNGQYNNDTYTDWETYAFKKGIPFTNIQGWYHDEARDSFQDIAYWILLKAPAPDLVLAYAKAHPDVRMRIYL